MAGPLMTEHIRAALIVAELKLQDLQNSEYEDVVHGRGTKPKEREMIAGETAVAVLTCLNDAFKDD